MGRPDAHSGGFFERKIFFRIFGKTTFALYLKWHPDFTLTVISNPAAPLCCPKNPRITQAVFSE